MPDTETKKELRLVQWQADVAIRNAFQDLAPKLADAVVAAASSPASLDPPILTPQGRIQVLKSLDEMLVPLFGPEKGKDSKALVSSIVAEHTAKARRRVVRRVTKDMIDRLPDDLRRVIGKGLAP